MSDPIKRLHYYEQQFLRSTDFTAEQNYHMSMRRLHNQVLHTWGVAQGLTLSLAGMTLTVAPGVAVDSQGREMVINIATNLDLANMPVNTTQYVTIAYAEQTSDHTTETGGDGDTRWTEQPVITMATALPADASLALMLGQVTRAQDGSFSLNITNRQKAATVLPDDLAANSLSLKSPAATPAQWPRLSSTGPNQAALNGSLTATGDVSGNNVVAAAYLKGAAANVAGVVNCDQVVQKNPAPDLQVKNSLSVGSPAVSGSAGSISASGDVACNRFYTGPMGSPEGTGSIFASGTWAELGFARRNLTTWPGNPVAGDRYVWVNGDGSSATLWTDIAGNLLSVTKDGKVGIGTAAPSQKLDVQGSISASGSISGNDVAASNSLTVGSVSFGTNPGAITATGPGAQLVFARRDYTKAPATWAAGDVYSWHNDSGVAQLWTPVNDQLLSVTKDGKVGIGTGIPSQKLDVQGNINATGTVTCDHVVQNNPPADLQVKDGLTVGPFVPGTYEGAVYATGKSAQFTFFKSTLTSIPAIGFTSGDYYSWGNTSGTATLGTVSGSLLSVTKDGKVGIGTTTPSQKLDVQGAINASGDVACNRFYTGPMGSPEGTGSIFASGTWAELGFARRNLTTWPGNPVAGDRYVWVNGDGSSATLWTDVAGNLLSVTKGGDVSATGKVTCDHVVQTNPAPGTRQILIGSYDKGIGSLPEGTWYFGETVTFPTAFTDTPVVQASLSRVDVDGNVKVQVYTESISKTNFVLKFHTWGPGTVWNLTVTWIAVL